MGPLVTALLFYFPFLLTIVFGFFTVAIGILAIFSGTVVVLFLAAYGLYAVLRDLGLIEQGIHRLHGLWKYINHDMKTNLQQSFLLVNKELLPSCPALFICHPHGLFGYSWMLHFCYGISEWPLNKPKPVVAIHSILFRIPLVRDILEQFRCIEARDEIIRSHLQRGVSVALVTGGIEEMRHNGDKNIKLILKKRKGYARIAKDVLVPIVPLFTRGENELFPNETFWLWKSVATVIHTWTSVQIPLPSWSSMKQWATILQGPLKTPIETVVLGVIDTEKHDEVAIRTACETLYTQFFQTMNIPAEIIA